MINYFLILFIFLFITIFSFFKKKITLREKTRRKKNKECDFKIRQIKKHIRYDRDIKQHHTFVYASFRSLRKL